MKKVATRNGQSKLNLYPPRPLGREPKPNTAKLSLLITDAEGRQKLYLVRVLPHRSTMGNGAWELENLDDGRVYQLADSFEFGWVCSCPGWAKRPPAGPAGRGRRACKHVRAFKAARMALVCGRPTDKPGEEWATSGR